jgi:hypothetical protein
MVRLEALVDSWTAIHPDTARAGEDFPAAELDLKAAERHVSIDTAVR